MFRFAFLLAVGTILATAAVEEISADYEQSEDWSGEPIDNEYTFGVKLYWKQKAINSALNIKNCGVNSSNGSRFEEMIVGGSEARPGGWPWTVAIFRGGRFICGGSIINARYVLTAAHCVPRENRPESVAVYRVLVGAHRLHGSGRLVEATDIVRHESYDSQRMQNDIALIRLKQELSWAEKGPGQLGPVCLPPTMLDSGLEHSQSTVVGWGHVREGGAISPTLQEVKIPIIGNSECARVYGSRMVQAGNICAAHPQGGYDSCQGDSGGPMMVKRAGRQYQMGIVSWGTGCARPRAPGVYTRVSQFVHWILRRIRKFPKDIEDTSLPL